MSNATNVQRWPFREITPWPSSCYNQDKCRTNLKCWWGLADNMCIHQDQDISAQVRADNARVKLREPPTEGETGNR
jgi:hypothetical protein